MKNIKNYKIKVYFENGNIGKQYNYDEIVKDYIIENELYKKEYNSYAISNEIVSWISNFQSTQIDLNSVFFYLFINQYVEKFYKNNKELFIIGKNNEF